MKSRYRCSLVLLLSAVSLGAAASLSFLATAAEPDPLDWLSWRGPEQNGISRELGIVDTFDPRRGTNVLWKREDIESRSTPVIMDGRLYITAVSELGTPREGEKVICLNAATGQTIWESKFNVYLSDAPVERAGWSCVTADPETGYVYALGMCGLFQCFDGQTGAVKWSHSMHEEFGLLSTYGGRTNVPVIFEDQVIISAIVIGWGEMARPAHRFMAFDKRTGEMRWFEGTRPLPYDTTYSTPFVTVLNGRAAIVFGSGDGAVWALEPRTGRQIWQYQLSRAAGLNVSPLVVGDTVFTSHSEENVADNTMGAIVAINGALKGDITQSGKLWEKRQIQAGKSSPLYLDGRVYFVDDFTGIWIFDAKTGKQIGAPGNDRTRKIGGTAMRSSLLYADGKIFACSRSGIFGAYQPTPNGVTRIGGRRGMIRVRTGQSYGSPVVSHGRLYLPQTECLWCLGKQGQQPKATPIPEPPKEKQGDATPAHVQVTPCEVIMKPGETKTFRVRLFNDMGQLMDDTPEATFSVASGGKINVRGEFTAEAGDQHQAAYVVAKVGDLTGRARVRIIPKLPWAFDFKDAQVPVTWLGMRHRHQVLDSELQQKLAKMDQQQGARSAELYVFLTSAFFNANNPPMVKFDDRLPRKPWSSFLAFFNQDDFKLPNLQASRNYFDASLKILQQEKVISGFTWEGQAGGKQLTVQKGARAFRQGNQGMYKMDNIPVPGGITQLGTRSRGWIGPADLKDYTIQADVMALQKTGRKVGDIGLIAQGYTFTVLGTNNLLQIRSWATQRRMAKSVPFTMKPGEWYTMKLKASNAGEKAVLQGKIWPRGENEPAEWTLTADDPSPNRSGSPGFFGASREPGSPFFVDNVKVSPN